MKKAFVVRYTTHCGGWPTLVGVFLSHEVADREVCRLIADSVQKLDQWQRQIWNERSPDLWEDYSGHYFFEETNIIE